MGYCADLQHSEQRTLAWKHSQYFFRQRDLRQAQPFTWPPIDSVTCQW